LVVLRAGQTDGVWWEVRRAVETLSPERLLLLIPYNKSQYEVFREEARQYLLHELPEYKGAARLLNASIKGYIYFGPDWVPHFVKLKAPLTRAIGYGGELERKLRSSLRPVFKQLNVRWTPPRFKWARSGLVVGGVLVAVLSSALILHLLTKPATPSEAAYARALEHLRWNPELNKASGNLSPQGAGQAVAELAARGYPRLDDSTLLLRATLLRRMLAAADVLTCDSMARGQVSAAQLNAVLKKLEPSEIEAFFSVMEKAALAELREAPPPKYSEREVADAFDSLRSKMSYSEADRVPCLAARRLYDNLVTLKEPHRGIVLHSLAAGRTE
jgi:hypothetical protein